MDTSINQYINFSENLAKICYTLKNFNNEFKCTAEEKREFEYYYNLIPDNHFQNKGMNFLKQLLDRLKDLQDEKSKRENGEGSGDEDSGSSNSGSENGEESEENEGSNSGSGKGKSKEKDSEEKENSGSGEGESENKDNQDSNSDESNESDEEENSENGSSGSGTKRPSDMTNEEIDQEIKDIIETIKKLIQQGMISNDITEGVEGASNELTAAERLTLEDLVKSTLESAKQRGKIPGNLSGVIEDLYFKDPIISWKKEFRNMIGSIPCPYKTTMRVKNRRQPHRADISGRVYDRKVKICIAIDTSGSVDDNQLMYFFNEIFHLTKDYNTIITLIQCDTNVSSVSTIKDKKDVKHIKVTGRGGTSFTPVFEYIKNDVKKLEQPDLLIYFTDGYGESEIDTNLRGHFDLMWVISGLKDELSVQTPSFINKVRYLNIEGKQYR
jgi:predicted metal-dependent peptidase